MPQAKPRLYRDPVHDTIAFAPDTDEGRLVIALLDTREMQRLRRVRQLALSHLVYHGAEHSRFAHSLGVVWLAAQMLDRLERSVSVTSEARLATVAVALLHDLGHAPFSHALEGICGVAHEARAGQIIRDPDSDVHKVLATIDPSFPETVASWMHATDDHPAFLRELIASQLDADRLDYILRDGWMTGVKIGSYDLARVLAMVDVVDGHLAVHEGGQAAVEGYLLARFHMYQQVYLHKTSRGAERVLVAALDRAGELHRAGEGPSFWPDGPLGRLLTGEALTAGAFVTLDDFDVWRALKSWVDESDRVLSDLATALVHRRLWKTAQLPTGDSLRADELVASARSIARVNGWDPDRHVLVDESSDSPYRPFTGVGSSAGAILMITSTGRGTPIEDRSEVVRMLGQMRHRQRLLCFHPGLRDALQPLLR
ncbi:MAG: HD domain-containing protein [Myxococcota bacterium]|nr:HD domain-containing protein [Myxococcota bacterium]